MRVNIYLLTSLVYTIAPSLANPIDVRAALLPPSTDPFYAAPANVASLKPGTVIRTRPVPKAIEAVGGIRLAYKEAYQIVFRTTGQSGEVEVGLTTILVPNQGDPTKLLSYQTAEDSAFVDCAPSYTMQDGTPTIGGLTTKGEMIFVNKALKKGWFVAVPDYEGSKATFLANIAAGQRVLDSVRAILASSSLSGVAAKPKIALWGYSGGSLASGFAAERQPTYAPELTLAGAALGGTVPNILNTLYSVNESPFAGLIPAGILGLSFAYPELAAYINTIIVPAKNATFREAGQQCLTENIAKYAGQDVYTYTTDPEAFSSPLAQRITKENNQGSRGPKTPIYIYKGGKDFISRINDTDLLVQKYCDLGTSVNYNVYKSATHITLLASGFQGALGWLNDRLDGKAQTGCTKNVR